MMCKKSDFLWSAKNRNLFLHGLNQIKSDIPNFNWHSAYGARCGLMDMVQDHDEHLHMYCSCGYEWTGETRNAIAVPAMNVSEATGVE